MTMMKIEVFPDTSEPAGGHAVIRLKGIALLPPNATFRIDPIDETIDDSGEEGWPRGNHKPLATRQTPDGIELRIGPDIVDAPLLEPGTPVTISVPESQLTAELIWPDLPLSSRAAAAPVVMSPSQLAAELAAAERARQEAAERAARQAAEETRRKAEAAAAYAARIEEARVEATRAEAAKAEAARIAAALTPPAGPPAAPALFPVSTASGPAGADSTPPASLPARLDAAAAQEERMAAAARQLEAALALEPAGDTISLRPSPGATMPPQTQSRPTATLSSLKPTSDRPEPPVLGPLPERDLTLPSIIVKRAAEAAPSTVGGQPNAVEPARLRRETIDGELTSPAAAPSRLLPFLTGAGLAGIAVAAILTLTNVRPGSIIPPGGTTIADTAHKSGIADAFTAAAQSPRGDSATDVDLPTALRLADYNLHGVDRPIDRAEAEFWLKKAMSLTASHSQIRWAMTQLGTLAAEPVAGPPDYEKARLLWEIAAANGDPIAMCFLGTLLEHGLGVLADKGKALEYFKRSRGAGGCPNTDEAIARLSR